MTDETFLTSLRDGSIRVASDVVLPLPPWLEARVQWVEDELTRQYAPMVNTARSPITRFFESGHLPADLRDVSEACANLASYLDARLPASAEKSTALRKLLECKDAAVRAALPVRAE